MAERQPRYPRGEFGSRGQEIFERKIAPLVKDEDPYKFVGIDIDTEDFEIDEDSMAATGRLIERNPDAQIFMRRVGFPVTHWIGSRPKDDRPRFRRIES